MGDLDWEISKSKIYSLDLKSAYHQVPIQEETNHIQHLEPMINYTSFAEFLLESQMVLLASSEYNIIMKNNLCGI